MILSCAVRVVGLRARLLFNIAGSLPFSPGRSLARESLKRFASTNPAALPTTQYENFDGMHVDGLRVALYFITRVYGSDAESCWFAFSAVLCHVVFNLKKNSCSTHPFVSLGIVYYIFEKLVQRSTSARLRQRFAEMIRMTTGGVFPGLGITVRRLFRTGCLFFNSLGPHFRLNISVFNRMRRSTGNASLPVFQPHK